VRSPTSSHHFLFFFFFFWPSLFINFNQLFHPLLPIVSLFCVILLSPLILFLSHHICPESLFIIKFAFLTLRRACCVDYVSSVTSLLFLLQVCLPERRIVFHLDSKRGFSGISSDDNFSFSAGFSFGKETGTWWYQIRFVLPLTKLRIIITAMCKFIYNKKRTALFWVITQRVVIISYRRFGTTCRFYLHRSVTQNTTVLFLVIAQLAVVISYRRFGTNFRSHLQRSIRKKSAVLIYFAAEAFNHAYFQQGRVRAECEFSAEVITVTRGILLKFKGRK